MNTVFCAFEVLRARLFIIDLQFIIDKKKTVRLKPVSLFQSAYLTVSRHGRNGCFVFAVIPFFSELRPV